MSRFADPQATRTVDLGPCECPGTPHESDWAKVRSDLSGTEVAVLLNLPTTDDAADAVAPFITEWNLLGPDGEEWPPTPEALFALKGPTAKAIGDVLAEVVRDNVKLPNGSGSPSAASPRGRASRTPSTRRTPGT